MSSGSSSLLDALTRQVNAVLASSERPAVEQLTPEMGVRSDLGLDSLELAELTVRLEAEFGVDIFREGIVNTIGEIVDKLARVRSQ